MMIPSVISYLRAALAIRPRVWRFGLLRRHAMSELIGRRAMTLMTGLLVSAFNAQAAFNTQVDSAVSGSWFATSALTPAYQALAAGDNALAWQYLLSAVRTQSPPVSAWLPLYQAILSESDCGRGVPDATDAPATLYIQQRRSGEHQAFQLRWSSRVDRERILQGAQETIRLLPEVAPISAVVSTSPASKSIDATLIAASTEAVATSMDDEIGLESHELSAAPVAGVYQIVPTASATLSSLLLTPWPQQHWVYLSSDGNQLQLNPPQMVSGCPAVTLQWQWFDAKYQLLGAPWPIRVTARGAQLPDSVPEQAVWLSAVVTQTRYQGQLRIAEQQRLTLPVRWVRSAQGEP